MRLNASFGIRNFFVWLICFANPKCIGADGSVQFQKILPFAQANEIRIECVLKSSQDVDGVDLSGSMSHAKTGQKIWQGLLGQIALQAHATNSVTRQISGLKPELWSPNSPALYDLTVTAKKDGKILAEQSVRFGFRSFESQDGNFYLNGHPIFLRGLAINPPGRTIPTEVGESRAFAEAYVRFLKSQNINTIRLTHDSQVWFDVCDELGMLVYQGQYGSPLESEERKQSAPDFNRSIAAYEKLFETYACHPSIVIYILSNELPVSGARGRAFHDFLTRVHTTLKAWDSTRLYIGNAGYGEGREGDICDVHRYWGWYYNTFLTYYNLRDPKLYGDPAKQQPLTFSECVGSFTGPDGAFNLVVRKQLGAQLNWIGHSPNQREDALRYQSFIAGQAAESFRRLRPLNHRLAGLMPFTILFHNWSGITSFEQMKAKPAMSQLAMAYQPVLLSWEMWTPQVYAGTIIHPTAHVINDADDYSALRISAIIYRLQASDGREILKAELKLPEIAYYETWSKRLELQLPAELPTGDYHISGEVVSAGRTISTNETELFVAGKDWKESLGASPGQSVYLFDPVGRTAKAFEKLQIPFIPVRDLNSPTEGAGIIVIGENALSSGTNATAASLASFIRAGGRVLCLQQAAGRFDQSWLPEPITFFTDSANTPTYPPASRPFRDNMNINPERSDHAVFLGLDRQRLSLWSDYSDWDQTKPGFPALYPVTAGFKLAKTKSLARTAVLADYDRGLEGIALCEMFSGRGSVVLSAFDLVARAGLDPVADRLLANLVRYAAATNHHQIHPLIDSPIHWGDYVSERGLITGPANGLVLNAIWVKPPTNPSAEPLTQEEGAWNTRPGDQFVPHGRRPFGPYGYTTSTSLRDLNPQSKTGSGIFWARIPAGKSRVLTSLENPSDEAAECSIEINEEPSSEKTVVPPKKTMQISTSLPSGITDVSVRYTGSKAIVLLQTSFE